MKLSLCLIQRQLYHDKFPYGKPQTDEVARGGITMKRKNIQIPTDLFLNLCNYHLAGIRSSEQEQRIQQGLQDKLDAVRRRSDYQNDKYADI